MIGETVIIQIINGSRLHFLKAGDGFQQFLLAASGDTCDAEDLSSVGSEGNIMEFFNALGILHGQITDLQTRGDIVHLFPRDIQSYRTPDHHIGHFRDRCLLRDHIAHKGTFPKNGNAIGNIHNFVKLMSDDNNGFAGIAHVAEDDKEPVCFLWGQNGGRFIQDQDIRAAIQYLNNLHGLFLRNGHIIDLLIGVDFKSVQIADLPDLLRCRLQIQFPGFVQSEDDVFRSSKDIYQLEVLMDHTDTERHGILRRTNGDFFSIHKNLSLIREVNAGEHVHQRGLTAAVFSQQRQNFSTINVQPALVICDDGTEAFCDIAHFNGNISFFQFFQVNHHFFFESLLLYKTVHRPPVCSLVQQTIIQNREARKLASLYDGSISVIRTAQ